MNDQVEISRAPHASEYERARKRVEKKREFRGNLAAYVVVNAFLVAIWALTGYGYFWPAWVMAGWGVGVILAGWDLYYRPPVTSADIEKEMRRNQ